MKNESILEDLQDVGLAHHFEALLPLARAAIGLQLTRIEEDNLLIGESKIGGRPDLPKAWNFPLELLPENTSRPYSFLGQINLSEISGGDKDGYLPESGMLYFFFSEDLWGDLERNTFFQVLYFDGDLTSLERKEFPENSDKNFIYPACSVTFGQHYDFPGDHPDFITDDEFEKYIDLKYLYDNNIKLLGFAKSIQNPAETSYYPIDGKKVLPENPDNREWRTLIQFGSNEESGMHWIDNGTIFFGIREDKLEENDFTKCCYNLQMY